MIDTLRADRPPAQVWPCSGSTAAQHSDGQYIRPIASMLAGVFFDWVAVAVFGLVLGGLTLARGLRVPPAIQAALGIVSLAAAWASALLLYEQIWWLDILAHLVLTGLLAAGASAVMGEARMLPAGEDRPGRWAIVIATTGVGSGLAVLWEVAEWLGYLYVDQNVDVAPGDTIGDLMAGVVGSAVAGALLARQGLRQ